MVRIAGILGVLLSLEACARASAPPAPAPIQQGTITTEVPVGPADSSNPLLSHVLRRANAAAARADTILVQPDSLILHVGQQVAPWRVLTIEARDRSDLPVLGFAPYFVVADTSVVGFEGGVLVGRRVGRTLLMLEPLSLDPAVQVRDIRAGVRLLVLP